MNVLSLFDGMSCGRIALERAGIKVDNYYSSEVDKYAIQVADKNYPQDAKNRLGDVKDIEGWEVGNIDLLIGGSPCQGFSFAGRQLNFEDERSKLFFEYVRLLKECKPKYFLLENVIMKQEYVEVISDLLGVTPIRINSALVSATKRDRYYWTNIPSVTQPENKNIVFNDIKDDIVDERLIIPKTYNLTLNSNVIYNVNKPIRLGGYAGQGQGQRVYSMKGKSVCLSALGGGWGAKTGLYLDGITVRRPTLKELCRLQTVDDDYFDNLGYSYNQIAKMLGNGWTVDVIAHIFKGLI